MKSVKSVNKWDSSTKVKPGGARSISSSQQNLNLGGSFLNQNTRSEKSELNNSQILKGRLNSIAAGDLKHGGKIPLKTGGLSLENTQTMIQVTKKDGSVGGGDNSPRYQPPSALGAHRDNKDDINKQI